MSELPNLGDREKLEDWLRGYPPETAMQFAHRSAMRVAPTFWDLSGRFELSDLPVVRSILISGVAAFSPNIDMRREATEVAAETYDAAAAYAASGRTTDAAYGSDAAAAAYAAAAAAAAVSAAANNPYYAASRTADAAAYATAGQTSDEFDLKEISKSGSLPIGRLWSGESPLSVEWARVWSRWRDRGGMWHFWADWYARALKGDPQNWDMLAEVALLPTDTWEDDAVLERQILDIQARYAIGATHYSEEIVRGNDGLFHALPVSTINPDLFRNAVERVLDTVAEIEAKMDRSNAYTALIPEIHRLRDHFERYSDNPLRIWEVILKTHRHITNFVASGELPSGDLLVEDFLMDLDSSQIDIRRSDEEVAKTAKSRAAVRWRRLAKEEAEDAKRALSEAAQEADNNLRAELEEDKQALDPSEHETEDADDKRYRAVGRGLRMASIVRKEAAEAASDAAKLDKGLEIGSKWWDVIIEKFPGLFG